MSENISKIPSTRLQFFPVMMFAVVMGLSGLTLVYDKAHELLGFSAIIGDVLRFITSAIFIAVVILYLLKIIRYNSDVKKEINHPVRINFFAAISISFLLVSMLYKESLTEFAFLLFSFGAFLHLMFTFNTLKFWINNNLEVQHSNPAWFIPIVGNLLVPVSGVGFVSNTFLMFYFSIGIFFWIIMLAIILNRIIFHNQFAPKFMPTLFILIAPPSIGLIAYFKMTHHFDMFAQILFNLGLFFTFLLFFMYKNFVKIKFFISWWAFTFPLAAIALATMLAFDVTAIEFYRLLSYILIGIVTVVVLIVSFQTIKHMMKKEICIME